MMSVSSAPFAQSKLVAQSSTLPLEGAALRVSARGGIARVVLEQTFQNHHAEPLAVTYVMPLPADAAVSGFSFRIGDRTIVGEVDKKRAARERYEDAIARGHTAALLEQDRSSLFTQELGNIPPGAKVVCEIVLDQRLRWLDEGSWEFRFPLAAAPRYLGGPGRVADAHKIALEVAQTLAPRASLAMSIDDALTTGRSPESPSHPLQCAPNGAGFRVELGSGNRVELDRDVVVRWPVASLAPALTAIAESVNGKAHALFTIVPSQRYAKPLSGSGAQPPKPLESSPLAPPAATRASVVRDLVVLLDTSGSMHGAPLDAARRVAMALVDGLDEKDSIELIEFSNQPRRMWKTPIWATKENKQHALTWLAQLQASGGTEMREGILEALRPLRPDAQRQIVLITDGLIGFEQEIVETILERLPAGSRVHTVGVGSSVNRSLTGPAARAGKGIECVIGLGEDPERAVARLRARTEAPLVVDVTIEGAAILETAPARVPDLYAGAPVLLSAKVRPEGGEIVVRGRTANGTWEERVRIAPTECTTSAIAALFGREAVEDTETRVAAGGDRLAADRRVEALGLEYQIATRLTSWIAVDKTPAVDPRLPTRKEVVPQMLPHGMSVDGLGLREAAMAPMKSMAYAPAMSPAPMAPRGRAMSAPPPAQAFGGAPPSPPPPPAEREEADEKTMAADLADESYDDEIASARMIPPPQSHAARPQRSEEKAKAKKEAPGPIDALRKVLKRAIGRAVTTVAKLASRKGREITIVFEFAEAIDFDPATFVGFVLADGTTVHGKVDDSRTTRAGHFTAGQIARIVIVLDVDVDEGATIREIVFTNETFAVT